MHQRSVDNQNATQDSAELERWHGSANGYSYHGCRCQECTDAARVKRRRQRERAARQPYSEGAQWHGTCNGYTNHHCRCRPCRDAQKLYNVNYRTREKKRVEATFERAQKRAYAMTGERRQGALEAIAALHEALVAD